MSASTRSSSSASASASGTDSTDSESVPSKSSPPNESADVSGSANVLNALANEEKQQPQDIPERALTSKEERRRERGLQKQKILEALSSDDESDESSVKKKKKKKKGKHRELSVSERSDKVEDEMLTVIRKARLLSRIQQLTSRGAKPSKTFDHRSSEHEMTVEIARMEVTAERGARIKQGRMALMAASATIEKAARMWDQRFANYVTFQVDGVTSDVLLSITNYDDALEEGVEEIIGPQGKIPWYYRIGLNYASNCVERSTMNRFRNNPVHTAEVLAADPQLRQKVAEELVRAEHLYREQQAKSQARPQGRTVMQAPGQDIGQGVRVE